MGKAHTLSSARCRDEVSKLRSEHEHTEGLLQRHIRALQNEITDVNRALEQALSAFRTCVVPASIGAVKQASPATARRSLQPRRFAHA